MSSRFCFHKSGKIFFPCRNDAEFPASFFLRGFLATQQNVGQNLQNIKSMLRLKELIKERNLTYREIAQGLNVSPQYVSNVVNGHENVTLSVLSRFAHLLGVQVVELFDGYTKPQKLPEWGQSFCPYCGNVLLIKRRLNSL